ncbi:MAG: hypothetical protein F6K55_03540 [Moorea sp. SIO4A3]|nr:hypothetical protein [Moorena sp. SIO4A3]
MKGDFTRWTFDPSNRYSSVRLQQGRVLLDADWNEQLDIMAHREQIANKEIIGLHGVPDLNSFAVGFDNNENIKLGAGRCYVEGVLCENPQEDYKLDILTVPGIEQNGDYLVYLEVWQHHITAIEKPELVEPALGGPDTTTRTQTYWQLKALKLEDKKQWRKKCKELLDDKQKKGKLKVNNSGTGLPNDLYRVEIHEVGESVDNTTFKWARNNASMAAKVKKIGDNTVKIDKNNQIQFQQEQGKETWWIEITDQDRVKAGKPGDFLEVDHVGEDNTLLTIKSMPAGIEDEFDLENTTVRIWEAKASTIKSFDGAVEEPIELEKGLKVSFVDENNQQSNKYRTGDYWLIPTRTTQEGINEENKEPDGIVYHYCPLAIVNYNETQWTVPQDCREVFPALTEMARETALSNGRKLSIGVHSYNDARRAGTESSHTEDQLNIQGGKQLTLNAGYWQDELDKALEEDCPEYWKNELKKPQNTDTQAISFTICEQEVMRLTKDQLISDLSITGNKNLIVEGTSWLKGVVSIGEEAPDETIGLLVNPHLTNGSNEEVIGQKLAPTFTPSGENPTLTALHIDPTFNNSNNKDFNYGLRVEKGKVFIGELEKWKTWIGNSNKLLPDDNWHIGVDVRPTVDGNNTEDNLVGLYINPNFQNCSQPKVSWYGLIVDKGKVGIGRKALRDIPIDHQIGVNLRPKVDATNSEQKLVGLYIKPDFDTCCDITEAHKYGLIVEGGRVAFGPKIEVNGGSEEYLVDIGTDGDVNRLKVAGDLEVYGKVTYHAEKGEAGDIYLGQQDGDKVIIHGELETKHTSEKLKVISPLEVQLEGDNDQDFLSLFAANHTDAVNGRIVWKTGTVTNPPDPYTEEAKQVAAIYSTTNGDGSNSSTGDLRFQTSASGEPLRDRVVITPDGNVGIGTDDPETNQLKVTGTTDLDNLVVNHKLEVIEGANTDFHSLKITGEAVRAQPTLLIPEGNVCIGAESIPTIENINGAKIKFYVTGRDDEYVTIHTNLSVFGDTGVDKLTVTPELTATTANQELIAAEIEPTFDAAGNDNVKTLALKVVTGDVDLDNGNLNIKSGQLVFGTPDTTTEDKFRVTGGSTLLEGNLQVGKDTIALKVNQATQEVGIGGESLENYKLAVTGDTKLTGKLEVAPELEGTRNATEITPTFTGTGIQTAVLIDPKIKLVPAVLQKGKTKKSQIRSADLITATQFGLHVVNGNVALCSTSGGVAIGSDHPIGHKLRVTDGSMCLDGTLTATDDVLVATEIKPTLTSSGESQTLTALRINPTFTVDGTHTGVKQLGLLVESGDVQVVKDSSIVLKVNTTDQEVGIGGESESGYKLAVTGDTKLTGKLVVAPELEGTKNATEITPTLTSSTNNDVLTAVKINPTFTANHDNVQQLGLVVEQGDVAVSNGNVAIGGDFESDCKLVVAGKTKIKGQDLVLQVDQNTQEQGVLFQNSGGYYTWRIYREDAVPGDNDASLKISGGYNAADVKDLTNCVTIAPDGAVGIGKVPNSDGGVKLDVEGKIQTTGDVLIASDATLKENVKPLKNGLKKILGLRGVSYQWKDDQKATRETQIGLVAQEVEKVFPELVSTDSQGMKSMSYSKLIAPLIEAIKEQNKKILELAKQVKQQQTKITQLQALNKE